MSPQDHGTSHLSVVDSQRGVVALTTTINTMFGSMFMSNSTGLLLNNEMDDFSTPAQANVYGLPPSAPNFIRPGKKPLSSMSPTLVLDPQGRLVAALGASGGPRIITAVLQTLIRLLAFGQDALQALAGPRLHHQLLPDIVRAEHWSMSNTTGPSFMVSDAQVQGLRARGHLVDLGDSVGVTQAIVVDPDENTLIGASDPRKDGAPAGF
ncbi:Gamma-glutamyltranspeptidase 3 [Trebouxia sp. C0010 RCD-2024]